MRGETYVVDLLVGDAAVVLQDVVVLGAGGLDQLLGDGLMGEQGSVLLALSYIHIHTYRHFFLCSHTCREARIKGRRKGHIPGSR